MEIYRPPKSGGTLERTTQLAVAAHPDDIELTSLFAIAKCRDSETEHFTATVLTDGASSPRDGAYKNVTDAEMVRLRVEEQKKAAELGKYNAVVMFGYSSSSIKGDAADSVSRELARLISDCRPRVIYTHNPFDRHPTHIATMQRVIEAVRLIPKELRPEKLYGCEVWRSLDWLPEKYRTDFDTSGQLDFAAELLGVFKSQTDGGKRYDLAVCGRQRANATFAESHRCDEFLSSAVAVDMTELIEDNSLTIAKFAERLVDSFKEQVISALEHP